MKPTLMDRAWDSYVVFLVVCAAMVGVPAGVLVMAWRAHPAATLTVVLWVLTAVLVWAWWPGHTSRSVRQEVGRLNAGFLAALTGVLATVLTASMVA